MKPDWRRASKAHPCPICNRPNHDHTSTWCIHKRDGTTAICSFVSDGAKRFLDGSGYLHELIADVKPRSFGSYKSVRSDPVRVYDWPGLAAFFRRRAGGLIVGLAKSLGVTAQALERLGVGLQGDKAWTFPMQAESRIVGIRIRYESGAKRAVYGSRSGLFVPDGFRPNCKLVICEGPTDAAALLSIGVECVGRASCLDGTAQLAPLAKGRDVVIVADNDKPGRDGAARLAAALTLTKSMRIVVPPDGIKDARAWCAAGATAREFA